MVQARVRARLDEAFMDWKASDFAPGEFARPRGREPAQTGKMTWKKLTALIKAGYGQGHFQRYKPWLRVTKRDYSPNSNIGHLPNTALGRAHHYRARAERGTILLLRWLGAADIREAFPIWPWPHRHPGFGLPGFEHCEELPGLLSIAEAAEVPHGYYVGSAIPYVATIDMVATYQDAPGSYRLVALENKPESIAAELDPLSRAKERLELARRYCTHADIPRVLIHAEKLPPELVVNLDLLAPQLTNPQQSALLGSPIYRQVLELLQAKGHSTSPNELTGHLGARFGHSPSMLQAATHLAIWRQDIDHDLTLPFMPWQPLVRGGRVLKQELQSQWFGERP
ncbi:MAG: TnsA endonuclease N-terminal domain-containing protein [Rubrivivax sp.]|nr:TnsA endonuclease N-terminal domain-containing protein [Rubrivivax sp.]